MEVICGISFLQKESEVSSRAGLEIPFISIYGEINKIMDVHKTEYYTVVKRNELPIYLPARMNLKNLY